MTVGKDEGTPSWFDKLTMRATECTVVPEDLMVSVSNHEVRKGWIPACAGMMW